MLSSIKHRLTTEMRQNLLTILIGAILGVLYLFYMGYSEFNATPGGTVILLAIVVGIVNGFAIQAENRWINKWNEWRGKELSRLLSGLIINFITVLIITSVLVLPFLFYSNPDAYGQIASEFLDLSVKFCIVVFIGLIVHNVIYLAQYSYYQYANAQIKSLKQDRKQLKLQFEALKSQLSPHYLFNSLNTISSLIYKDGHLAENFIRRLAMTYEYILDTHGAKYVQLKEELEFVKSYNYLLQVRFGNSLNLAINVPEELLDTKIPPLTLQMLVENAVKHNAISDDEPMNIEVRTNDNSCIEVINNKNTPIKNKSSFEVGLENIKRRYGLLSKKKVLIEDGDQFKVTLPIITTLSLQSA